MCNIEKCYDCEAYNKGKYSSSGDSCRVWEELLRCLRSCDLSKKEVHDNLIASYLYWHPWEREGSVYWKSLNTDGYSDEEINDIIKRTIPEED